MAVLLMFPAAAPPLWTVVSMLGCGALLFFVLSAWFDGARD